MLLKHATHELDFIIIQPNQVYQLYLVACLKSFSPEIQIFHYTLKCITLKADRPHLHDYLQTPTDCIHTDNHLRRVIVVVRALTYRETDGQTDGWSLLSTLCRPKNPGCLWCATQNLPPQDRGTGGGMPLGHTQILHPRNLWHISPIGPPAPSRQHPVLNALLVITIGIVTITLTTWICPTWCCNCLQISYLQCK